jgi:hypothetical protein
VSEFVTIDVQQAMRMRHIVICGLPCSTIYFHIIFRDNTVFGVGRGGVFEHKMCVLISSEAFLIIRRTERDVIKHVCRSSCKVPIILDRF